MLEFYCIIEQEAGCDFPIVRCPLVLRKWVMPYEHNGSAYSIASSFRGSVLHR